MFGKVKLERTERLLLGVSTLEEARRNEELEDDMGVTVDAARVNGELGDDTGIADLSMHEEDDDYDEDLLDDEEMYDVEDIN